MTPSPSRGRTAVMWADRVQAAYDVWHNWTAIPGRFRMDRALKAAGVRDLIVENQELRDEVDALRVANGQLCAQARECKRTDEALVEALQEADHWHVYSVEAGDPDGNVVRIEKVQAAIHRALALLTPALR